MALDPASTVSMVIVYDVKKDKYAVTGNIKPERYKEVVSDFIRTQMGQGSDKSKPKMLNKYRIGLKLDVSSDTFQVSYNTGNKALRDGILLNFLQNLESRLE